VAAAAEELAAHHGVSLPDHLRVWALAGGRPAEPVHQTQPGEQVDRPDGAGRAPEGREGDGAAVLAETLERRTAGLHVTPGWLADRLVALGLGEADGASDCASADSGGAASTRDGPATAPAHGTAGQGIGHESWPTVCDPACGGGAFLVAAADALHRRGVPRRQVVRGLLWGADVDQVGIATAEAALAIWSEGEVPPPGRLVVGDPLCEGASIWPDRPTAGFGLVVGNPPFQNQLGRATARQPADRERLRARFGGVLRAYTDTAWLFLLLGCELARPGGRVVLVQPDSVAAARDAAAVRAAVDQRARIVDLWVDDRPVFDANVRVCAPVLEIDGTVVAGSMPRGEGSDGPAPAGSGEAAGAAPAPLPHRGRGAWHDLLADATGIPEVALAATAGRLGDRATIIAGFRDEYYGLVPLVREAAAADAAAVTADGSEAPLVTAGVIDWGRSAWGRRPVHFAKRRWVAPVIDLARLRAAGSPAARRWVERTLVPKILVATQTKVVEVAVDERGTWVPSVPVIAVVPHRPHDLWPLAAALAAPAASAWLTRRAPGVGLHRGALKVSRGDLAELPLPSASHASNAAAAALRDVAAAAERADPQRSTGVPDAGTLDRFVTAAAAAYGSDPAVVEWWRQRVGDLG
jgi:hypothetical protein